MGDLAIETIKVRRDSNARRRTVIHQTYDPLTLLISISALTRSDL
jgi:hypothetical protein